MCPQGKYSLEAGMTACDGCPAGKHLIGGSDPQTCGACKAGTYTGSDGAHECAPCQSGRYAPHVNATSCLFCGPGRYTPEEYSTSCEGTCDAGTFSSRFGSTSSEDCQKCPVGTFQFQKGMSFCSVCPAGSFSGTVGSRTCRPCDYNTYSNVSGASTCTACPPGQITQTKGGIDCVDPVPCSAGQWSTDGFAPCRPCPIGTRSAKNSRSNGTISTACVPCAPGTVSSSVGSALCTACGDSEISSADGTRCTACSGNSIPEVSNRTRCVACTTGKSAVRGTCAQLRECSAGQWSTDGFAPCRPCPIGTRSAKNSRSNGTISTACVPCAPGTVSSSVGSALCTACGDSEISSADGTRCTACSGNSIPEVSNRTRCVACTTGKSAVRGTCTQLRECNIGQYSLTGYGPDCWSCPAGRYSNLVGAKGSQGEGCTLVPYGSYASGSGNPQPTECGVSQYTEHEGSVSTDACKKCPPGAVPTDEKSGCKKCEESEYVADGKCLKDAASSSAQEAISGVFANEGTPFYTLVILCLMMAFLSLMVYYTKTSKHDTLLQLSLARHLYYSSVPFAAFILEMIVAVGAFTSGVKELQAAASLLLVSRWIVAVTPGVKVIRNSIFGRKKPVVDPRTGKKNIKYYLDVEVISLNHEVYAMLLVFSLFEPTLLQFLPWYQTELSRAAEYPTLRIMRLTYGFKACQLLVTFVGQVMILAMVSHYNSTFGIVAILNIVFTLFTFLMKSFEMIVKWGILRGSPMSDDCEAAQKAARIKDSAAAAAEAEDAERRAGRPGSGGDGAGGEGDPEAGEIQPPSDWIDNPLHVTPPRDDSPHATAMTASTATAHGGTVDAGGTDADTVTNEATDESKAESQPLLQRVQAVENENQGLVKMVREQASKMAVMQEEMRSLRRDNDNPADTDSV